MQCSSPESFNSVDQAHSADDHRSALRTTLSKIALYNFAAEHRLDTPIELAERLILCVSLANEDRPLTRLELRQITMINPFTIDSALINLVQRDEVHMILQQTSDQAVYGLTALGQTVAVSLDSWTTSFYQYARCGSDTGVRDLLHQLQQAIRNMIATDTIPTMRTCIACEYFSSAAHALDPQTAGYCRFLRTPLSIQRTKSAAPGIHTP